MEEGHTGRRGSSENSACKERTAPHVRKLSNEMAVWGATPWLGRDNVYVQVLDGKEVVPESRLPHYGSQSWSQLCKFKWAITACRL